MTVLLFGAGGQIGWHLARLLPSIGKTRALARGDADFIEPQKIREAIRAARPRIIVNAAAYTDVDGAEAQREIAHAINAEAPELIANEARACGALLVHYSTAFVFDGAASRPYVESDPTDPISEYGRSKLAGERAVAASGAAHLVLRTNWIYDARGRNFVKTLLDLALEREELRVVEDQIGSPTWAKRVAEATVAMLRDEDRARGAPGIYHLTALGSVTRCELARRLCEVASERSGKAAARVVPIASAEYPTAAKRPPNSVLDTGRIVGTFGVKLRAWEDDLDAWLAERHS